MKRLISTDKKVLCIKKVYNIYEVGKTYDAKYLYDRCLVGHNNYIEYEWMVFCGEHNHYQFMDSELNEFFVDLIETRDSKISDILKDT